MVNIKSKIAEGWIHCSFIVEMMGKPKEHLQNTLKKYVERLNKDNKIEFIDKEYAEPKKLEDSNIYTVFVEMEVLMKDVQKVIEFCFDSMPSSVEIIDPTQIVLKNDAFNGLLNDLQARLHKMDMRLKNLSQENKVLKRNSSLLVQNSIFLALDKKKKLKELSEVTKIPEKELKKFLDMLVKADKIKFEKNYYSLA